MAPATLQFVEGGVKLAPLAPGEKAPFQSVLEPIVIFSLPAPGEFSAGAPDFEPIEDRMMPCAIISSLANETIQLPPILLRDLFFPVVKVAQDRSHAPPRAGVANVRQVWKRFLN